MLLFEEKTKQNKPWSLGSVQNETSILCVTERRIVHLNCRLLTFFSAWFCFHRILTSHFSFASLPHFEDWLPFFSTVCVLHVCLSAHTLSIILPRRQPPENPAFTSIDYALSSLQEALLSYKTTPRSLQEPIYLWHLPKDDLHFLRHVP